MIFGKFLYRKSISCLGKKEKELITEWLENEGWDFDDFAIFLQLVGIRTPIRVLKTNLKESIFICRSKDGKEYKIKLVFGDLIDSPSEIHVTHGMKTKGYICPTRSRAINNPILNCNSSVLRKNGKVLKTMYSQYEYTMSLLIDAIYTLTIKFDYSNLEYVKLGNVFLEQIDDLENFVFSQNSELDIIKVFEQIKKILELSEKDVALYEKINIVFEKYYENEKNVLYCIKLSRGSIKEYAITENLETFHVYSDKSWRYSANGLCILYKAESKNYIFSANGTEDVIAIIKPKEILSNVKERISILRKSIE